MELHRMNALPLFYYPSRWLLVDDDPVLRSCMASIFATYANIESFSSALECIHYLDEYKPSSVENGFLESDFESENYGLLQHTPINFDLTNLLKIAHNPNRHNEITAMVMDYNMPEMDGL